MFIDVVVMLGNHEQKRLININKIKQVIENEFDEKTIYLDIESDKFIKIKSDIKEFKIKINNIKKT